MKICIIGTGYVGLVTGTCLAEMGNEVICVDNDKNKLDNLAKGIIPIYEPGLEEIISVNVAESRLLFTDDLEYAVKASLVCFIAVGTPEDEEGRANLSYVFDVAKHIAKNMNEYKVIVNKSTVPVGTADKVYDIIKNNTKHDFDIVSNPEFLKQGDAVNDFLKPDRVIIGTDGDKAKNIMQDIYSPFLRTGNPIIVMDIKSAEMTKYAANAFLATKISFANEIANICERVGADCDLVRVGMSSDKRIGNQFLFAGIGYGGSCFPKDVKALVNIAQDVSYDASILKATDDVNKKQRLIFVNKILNYYKNEINGKKFSVWGLAFKPNTNDMRESPAITIIEKLLEYGATIEAFDPKATETAKHIFEDKIKYRKNIYETLDNADAILLLTEWHEFRRPNFDKIKSMMKSNVIFDGRNQYEQSKIKERGFEYICIGR